MQTNQMDVAAFTLTEILIVLVIAGTIGLIGASGFRSYAEAVAVAGAVEEVSGRLTLARRLAVNRRERIRVRVSDGSLVLYTSADSPLYQSRIAGSHAPLDSIRLRPPTLGFNPRGQASPGSAYLYRGSRGVRIVINFLGRLRRQRL